MFYHWAVFTTLQLQLRFVQFSAERTDAERPSKSCAIAMVFAHSWKQNKETKQRRKEGSVWNIWEGKSNSQKDFPSKV